MLDYDNARSSYYTVCHLYALEKNPAALCFFLDYNLLTLGGNKPNLFAYSYLKAN